MHRHSKTILLVGTVDAGAAGELLEYCRGLAEQGWRWALIDMSAVAECDLDGLLGLSEVHAGGCGLPVRVIGARWSQFLPALHATGVGDLPALRDRIRALVTAPALTARDPDGVFASRSGRPARGRAPHHAPTHTEAAR
jgi:hypothetical protein